MRVALFSDTFFPQVNGVASVVMQTIGMLQKRGHDVQVFTASQDKKKRPWPDGINRARVTTLPAFGVSVYPGERCAIPIGTTVAKIKRFRPDIIHVHTPFSVGWEAVLDSSLLKIPLVGTHHTFYDFYLKHVNADYEWARRWSRNYMVSFYNHCDRVLAQTVSIGEALQTHGLTRPLDILLNPVDTKLFQPPTANERTKQKHVLGVQGRVIAYMGRLSYEKSIDEILRVMSRLIPTHPDTTLLIIGDGPEKKELEQLANDLKISNHVRFLGYQFGQKLAEALYASDIFVTASKSENMPVSILEAMAAGLPCVAPRALGIPEVIKDGVNGHLVEPDDTVAFTEKVSELLSQPAKRETFGAASRQLALGYAPERIMSDLERIYELATRV